jgi:hypothetical protein
MRSYQHVFLICVVIIGLCGTHGTGEKRVQDFGGKA